MKQLYEYGKAPGARLTYTSDYGVIKFKLASGEIVELNAFASEDGGLYFFKKNYERMKVFISSNKGIDNYIANGHMLFNILGVVAFIPFVGYFERLLNYLLPDKKNHK